MAIIETALTRLLGIEHPILLAPMGSAAGGKLAAAVTHAGGLGMVGSGYASTTAIRQELGEAGNARVGIGFILWALESNPAALDVALDASPAAVMLSFGDPDAVHRPHQGGRMQDHLPGADAGAGEAGRRRRRRHHHRAGARRRRPFGHDARHDRACAGGRRCRRADPGRRRRRHRRWARPRRGAVARRGGHFDGYALYRHHASRCGTRR